MNDDGSNAAAYSLMDLSNGHNSTPHHHHRQQNIANYNSSSSSIPQEYQRLQQHFENQAGIRPSHAWLEQCLLHIRGGSASIDNVDEEIWNQILHADLRDVIRVPLSHSSERNNDDDDDSAGSAAHTAARQLRHAILQSSNIYASNRSITNSNGEFQSSKAVLPPSFQLLVQIEELVDVTMSGEQQLAAVGDNPVANNTYNSSIRQQHQHQNIGSASRNPKYRCLKMVFSDGYHPDGTSRSERANLLANDGKENHEHIMFARETSPILNLSLSSPPGVKLVLNGPISIRCGMLELNDGNCVVAGGEISSWKLIRSKAKEKAQRERGLGVDPTIKALIWNPVMGDEDEVDEGESESGDIPVAPAMEATIPTPPTLAQAPSQPIITPDQPTAAHPDSSRQSSSQSRYHSHASSAAMNITVTSHRDSNGGEHMRQTTLDLFPKKPRPETTRLLPKNTSSSSAFTNNRTHPTQHQNTSMRGNICQLSNSSTGGRMNSHVNNLAPMFHQRPPPSSTIQNNANIISVDYSPPHSTTHTTSKQPLQQPVLINPYASLRPTSCDSSVVPHGETNNVGTSTTSRVSSTSFTSNPSFSELKAILHALRSNRALYEQYCGKIITVPCKMNDSGNENLFNIVKSSHDGGVSSGGGGGDGSAKKKKDKTKKDKKYEFLLVGKFIGPKQSDGAIACRVDSSLVEPYFNGNTPALLRKLSREDKDRANRIVNQSSSQFLHDFSSLCQFQLRLILSAEEFFAKIPSLSSSRDDWMADVNNPLLLVINKTT